MIRAVLFDLDGTLLDIDLSSFLDEYFQALGPVLARLTGSDPQQALDALMRATAAMCEPHDGRTNADVFNETFTSITGVDLSAHRAADSVETFYRDVFPSLKSTHGPRPGAHECVASARALGLRTALATNPIFPRAAIMERLRWAELDESCFDVVTSYEDSEACKPLPRYFRQVSEQLDVSTAQCLMVGDDPVLDMAAADVGMQTFLVDAPPDAAWRWSGSLADLRGLLERIV